MLSVVREVPLDISGDWVSFEHPQDRGRFVLMRVLGQNGNVFITLTSLATGLQANGSQLSKGTSVFTA